jgi:hypothetical protein
VPQPQDQPPDPPIPAEGEPFSRADFVAFVRANHPDRGGDRETFEQGLARYRSARRGADRTGASEPDTPLGDGTPLIWVDPVNPVHRLVDRVRRRYRRHRRTRVR